MLNAFTWPRPTVNAVLAVRWRQFGALQPTPPADVPSSALPAPGLRALELRLAGPVVWTEYASVCWYRYSALYVAVCTISSGGFDLQQSSFHSCELVLATAGWIQKEDVFRESKPAEKSW